MRVGFARAVLGLALTAMSTNLFAETHALLIGVSSYPSLPAGRQLRGPLNDVTLMRAALVRFGLNPDRITLLADGHKDSQALPTRAAIFRGFATLAQSVKPGDWAIVYFSGHGSQQPQPRADTLPAGTYVEPDGLDEIFLPHDVTRWTGVQGTVHGAILDDEIGRQLQSLRAKGAHVWAIFDTCHAGDMGKGISGREGGPITRYVSPGSLGVPSDLLQYKHPAPAPNSAQPGATRKTGVLPSRSQRGLEATVLFYASQADEPAAEEPLAVPPLIQPDQGAMPAKSYFGLFTYLLAQAMLDWKGDFRELAEEISQKYKVRPYPTPMFEGDLKRSIKVRQFIQPQSLTNGEKARPKP